MMNCESFRLAFTVFYYFSSCTTEGFFKAKSDNSLISFESVAESKMVYQFSISDCSWRIFKICKIDSLNPISRSLSASSKIKVSMFPSSIDFEFKMMSMSLPGVATMISGLLFKRYSWYFMDEPPMMTACVTGGFVNFESCSSIDAHWAASSQEGWRMSTLVVRAVFALMRATFRSFLICFSNIGKRYEAVFPLPVTALARTSFPSRTRGITLLWILVGWSYSSVWQALTRGFDRNSSWNEIRSSFSYLGFSFWTIFSFSTGWTTCLGGY